MIMTEGTEGGLALVLLLTRMAVFVVKMLIIRRSSCPLHGRTYCFAISRTITSEVERQRKTRLIRAVGAACISFFDMCDCHDFIVSPFCHCQYVLVYGFTLQSCTEPCILKLVSYNVTPHLNT